MAKKSCNGLDRSSGTRDSEDGDMIPSAQYVANAENDDEKESPEPGGRAPEKYEEEY